MQSRYRMPLLAAMLLSSGCASQPIPLAVTCPSFPPPPQEIGPSRRALATWVNETVGGVLVLSGLAAGQLYTLQILPRLPTGYPSDPAGGVGCHAYDLRLRRCDVWCR